MEVFRKFLKELLEVVQAEFKSIEIVKWVDNDITINLWISKRFVTMEDSQKIEKVILDNFMRITSHVMFFPDTTLERMNMRILLPLEDNIIPK